MATFLFSGLNPQGKSVTERIDAPTTSSAKYKLELQGYRDIVFHVDEMASQIDAALHSEFPGFAPAGTLTPEQERNARQGGGVLREILFAFKLNSVFWLPLFLWNASSLYHGRPYGWGDLVGFGATVLFLLYFIWIVLPSIAYQKLLESGVYFRFAEVRRWASFIRFLKRVAFIPIPEFELDFRVAFGLAAEGRLQEALSLTQKYENHSCGKFQYYSRLASLYEAAGDYPQMTHFRRLAAENGRGQPEERIDIALGLLRRERKPHEALQILNEIDLSTCSDLIAIFHEYCRGLLAVELSEWPAAEERLRKTTTLAKDYENNVLMAGMLKDVKAYLSMSLGHLGKYPEGKNLFRTVEPLLRIRREHLLIERCCSALNLPTSATNTGELSHFSK